MQIFWKTWWTPRLAGPLIAATLVRLALLVVLLAHAGPNTLIQNDTNSYLEPGRNLLLHGSFFADGVPDLVRTPGYSLFLAIVSMAGLHAAALVNLFLSVFSVLLVWRLAHAAFGNERIALIAAWIFAFEPVSVNLSVILLSETLFLALFLLSMERLVEFLNGHRLRTLVMAGFWLAAATYVRPVTYYLPVMLALGLYVVLARIPGLRWKAPAVLLLTVLPWLAAWQIRNRVETGYAGFSSISEVNLYFYVAADVIAHVEHRDWYDVRDELGYTRFSKSYGQSYLYAPYLQRHPEQTGWTQGERLAFMHSEAVRTIRAHPGVYLRSCLVSLIKAVFGAAGGVNDLHTDAQPETVSQGGGALHRWIAMAKTSPGAAAMMVFFQLLLLGMYVLAAPGIFRSGWRNPCLWLMLGTTVYFLAVSAAGAGPLSDGRIRMPIMPMICIFAAVGFQHLTSRRLTQ